MNQIQNLPNTYGAGLSFNYTVWSPGTVITLCNVPWPADYKDIVDFSSKTALDSYLASTSGPTITFAASTYARSGMPIRIPLPFNDAYKYNYVKVTNPAQPSNPAETGPRSFYYFIRDIRHIAPNTTELELQLDVWQSFNRYVEYGSCFVERGHVGIADSNAFMDNGREILAQPEGFDVGSEYRVEKVYRRSYGAGSTGSYGIIVTSTTSLHTPPGSINDPRLITAEGSTYENLPNGANSYYWPSLSDFQNFMIELQNFPWVVQGIISITAVPAGIVDIATETVDVTFSLGSGTYTVHKMGSKVSNAEGAKPSRTGTVTLANDFRGDLSATSKLSGRYRNLKKFLVYPYSVVEVTTYNGSPIILKPECLTTGLNFTQFNHLAQPGPRIIFSPLAYNAGGGSNDGADDGAEFLDIQTGFYNFPMFSVANNSYMNFMASNTHRIAFDFSQADWSQQRALRGNEVNLQQAKWSQELLTNTTQLGADSAWVNTGIAGVASALNAGTATKDAKTPGQLNDASNYIDASSVNIAASFGQTAMSNAFNIAKTREINKNIGRTADLNKDYGDWAAKGDYSQEIASINARVQDARLFQPSVVGQMGGEAFNLAVHKWVLAAKVKMVTGAAFHAIGDYWLRYGYAINRFITNFRPSVMSNFTYWKVKELYITSGACPEMYKQTIRAIFEKGVTVWTDPNDIGRIALDNNDPIIGSYINV